MKIEYYLEKYKESILLTDEQPIIDECIKLSIPVIGLEINNARIDATYTLQLTESDSLDDIDEEYLEKAYCRQKGLPVHILETNRCIIREFCMNDLDNLFEFYDHLKEDKYVDPLFDYKEEKEYQKNYIKYIYDFYGYGMWLIFLKDNPAKIIGRAGLETRDTCEENEAELGYIIHPDYRRMGIASEICSSILEYGKNLGIKNFLCRIDDENYPSIEFARKLGFKYDKTKDLYLK